MNITTSGRRQLTANQVGIPFVNRYDNFGDKADIASVWKKPEAEFVLPEHMIKSVIRTIVFLLRFKRS